MIERVVVFVATETMDRDPEGANFEKVRDAVSESDNYISIHEDEEQEILWALPSADKKKYLTVIDCFEHLVVNIKHLLFFNISVDQELVNCEVFYGEKFEFTHVELFEGVPNNKGEDCVSQVEQLLDVSLSEFWDWNDLTTVYPVTMEI